MTHVNGWIRYLCALAFHYSGLDALYRLATGRGLVVLMLHRLRDEHDYYPLSTRVDTLSRLVQWLRQDDVLVSLDEGLARLQRGPRRVVHYAITLDDGYLDNLRLVEGEVLGTPATVYVATGHIGGEPIWAYRLSRAVETRSQDLLDLGVHGLGRFDLSRPSERERALQLLPPWLKQLSHDEFEARLGDVLEQLRPKEPVDARRDMMDWSDVRTLDEKGIDIGGHTCSHVLLSRVDDATARMEIEDCTRDIERELGRRPRHFAYPNGTWQDFGERDVDLVKRSGYATAATSIEGVNRPGTSQYLLLRHNVHDTRYRAPDGTLSRALFFSETSGLLGMLRTRLAA